MSTEYIVAPIKTYYKFEVAALYQISMKVFRSWLKAMGLKTGQRKQLTIKEVNQIFSTCGHPSIKAVPETTN